MIARTAEVGVMIDVAVVDTGRIETGVGHRDRGRLEATEAVSIPTTKFTSQDSPSAQLSTT